MQRTSQDDMLTAVKIARDIGPVSSWHKSTGDPCRPPMKTDDLAKGFGVPEGFKGMNFYVIVPAGDPRLTVKGTESICNQLRDMAYKWLWQQCKPDAICPNGRIACETPKVIISRADPIVCDPLSSGQIWVTIQVYVYPPLTPKVEQVDMNDLSP